MSSAVSRCSQEEPDILFEAAEHKDVEDDANNYTSPEQLESPSLQSQGNTQITAPMTIVDSSLPSSMLRIPRANAKQEQQLQTSKFAIPNLKLTLPTQLPLPFRRPVSYSETQSETLDEDHEDLLQSANSISRRLSDAKSSITDLVSNYKVKSTQKMTQIKHLINYGSKKIDIFDPRVSTENKIIGQLRNYLNSGLFYFSEELDLTNSIQRQRKGVTELNMRFWWNQALSLPFSSMASKWVVPVIQGFVQSEVCTVEDFTFELILISRRSRNRAGLRYQRRGVDEKGNVANFVETEQIVVMKISDQTHILSHVQIRGSIPIFFSQAASSLHPVPTFQRTSAENINALKKHFENLKENYGNVVVVNLVNKQGKEAVVGNMYSQIMEAAGVDLRYEAFDFHKECKGLKFENVSKLVNTLEESVRNSGYYWSSNGVTLCEQTGVVRTNCMDCLDRTNVVQNAFAKFVTNLQLMRIGVQSHPEKGIRQHQNFESKFNQVWANNGDAISRAYTGTSALKGDYTRTGKRQLKGVAMDAGTSVARLYLNNFRDDFKQSIIDFMLGVKGYDVFEESEASETSRKEEDASVEEGADLWKLRNHAVDVTSTMVMWEGESKIGAWVVYIPNNNRSAFQPERILILTNQALYSCVFNYSCDSVTEFKRIELQYITRIEYGPFNEGQATEQLAAIRIYFKPTADAFSLVNRSTASVQHQPEDFSDECAIDSNNVGAGFALYNKLIGWEKYLVFIAPNGNRIASSTDAVSDVGPKEGEIEVAELTSREAIEHIISSLVRAKLKVQALSIIVNECPIRVESTKLSVPNFGLLDRFKKAVSLSPS
ncbi:SacI homology domain-containing protein [Paraphysoderma sedebokerense]|nr:SacI homology domain-containing protein [Paraphysoderma sedebokerense]